jgi:hypothetical protein
MDLLGIDCSNYGGTPSEAALDELLRMGVKFAIPGTQNPTITRTQIDAFERRGISVPSVYCFLDFDGNDVARVQAALQFGKPVWLDVEVDSTDVAQLDASVAACAGNIAGIYTGRYYPIWQHSTGYSWLPLWHADYRDPSHADDIFERFAPYAGWTHPAVWQYQGTTQVAGFGVDLNLYREVAPAPPLPPVPSPLAVDHIELVMADGTHRTFKEVF